MSLNPDFVAQVARIAAALDGLDYFQLLRVTPEADLESIREGYRRQAQALHPDRYQSVATPELRADLDRIQKRITEAYVVLRDDEKRARYRTLISGPERQKNLRYSIVHEDEHRKEKEAAAGTTAQGRTLYAQATAAFARGDKAEAIKNLKMAVAFERDNAGFKELLERWQNPEAGA